MSAPLTEPEGPPSPRLSGSVIQREEPIVALTRLAEAFREALPADEAGKGKRRAAAAGFRAECVQCGIKLEGNDLLALAAPETELPADPRIQRLRLGYCARNGCDSHFYRLTLSPLPTVDWFALLSGTAEPMSAEPTSTESPAAARRRTEFVDRTRRLGLRVLLAAAVIATLLLVRHWRRGGTIPLIREPENFVVDPWPTSNLTPPR